MYQIKKPIYLSVDEWGSFGRNFLSVLAVAQYFNSFIRHADVVKMANYTLLTSLLQEEREKGSFKTPLFHTFKLFSNNCLGNSIDTYVECDTFNTKKYQGIPFLDVTTVHSKETNSVFINVVNRHKDKAMAADIITNAGTFTGKAEARLVNSDSLNEFFIFDKQEQYIPVTKEIEVEGNKISCSFPPHSFTQIKVGVRK
jgi:alpha-N-arabinofuranosidase